MPSIENPTFYERAEYVAAGNADDFFKWLDTDEFVETTGEAESPLGWVGLLRCDRDLIATYVSTFGDPWMSERRNFSPGWYIVRIDDAGFVWGMAYGGNCDLHGDLCADTAAEEAARADFAEAEEVASAWWRACDQEY
jgi:hypothetical protein